MGVSKQYLENMEILKRLRAASLFDQSLFGRVMRLTYEKRQLQAKVYQSWWFFQIKQKQSLIGILEQLSLRHTKTKDI